MLGVDGGDALEGGARILDRVAAAPQPAVGHLEQLAADAVGEAHDQVVAVAEVDVEGGPREAGARHQGIDREGAETAAAKQLLGGVEDLSLGLLGAPATAGWLASL